MGVTVIIVDNGARGHALSLAYEKSPQIDKIIVAPGNDFIAYKREKDVIVDKQCDLKDPLTILGLAKKYKPDLVDVAQDDALAAGTIDLLRENGFLAFGPTKAAARIEWDKIWSKEFMLRHSISTASFVTFEDQNAARKYVTDLYLLQKQKRTLYIKAAGLCGGKGALRAENWNEAMFAIEETGALGDAGKRFVIEEELIGEEFSAYALSDGIHYQLFPSAQDHKRLLNFDQGPQTGGMGSVSPVRVTSLFSTDIERTMKNTIEGMKQEGNQYEGILYLGGMVTERNNMTLEFNARWGDPECHVVLPSLQNNYLDLIHASLEGRLHTFSPVYDGLSRMCVIGAARGYPLNYSATKGKRIYGLEHAMHCEGVTVLGAGIEISDGKFYACGGRLFSVVGEGNTILEARQRVYAAIAPVYVEGNNLHYRTDIGWRDMEKTVKNRPSQMSGTKKLQSNFLCKNQKMP